MPQKETILLSKDEQIRVRAGNQALPGDGLNTTDPTYTSPTAGTLMVKDSSVT